MMNVSGIKGELDKLTLSVTENCIEIVERCIDKEQALLTLKSFAACQKKEAEKLKK